MKGRFSLEIESRRVIYQLSLERKVTVIKGNSGTGKTSMIRILSDYVELGKDSGVHIRKSSDYDIKILENRTDWHQELEQAHNCIMFVDEDVRYLYDKNFQSVFQGADCYIVIISRSGMFQQLPYAISSIYELQTRKNGKTSVVQMYRIYHERFEESSASYVITEDSNAGYEMMQPPPPCGSYHPHRSCRIVSAWTMIAAWSTAISPQSLTVNDSSRISPGRLLRSTSAQVSRPFSWFFTESR